MSETITLSDALRRIKAVKGDIARWSALFPASNVWAEDQPRPAYVLAEVEGNLHTLTAQLVTLKTALTIANSTCTITFDDRQLTLAEACYRLAENKSRQTVYAGLITASEKESMIDRRVYDEASKIVNVKVKQHSPVTTREKDAALKALRDEFAVLNSLLERANNTNTISI